MGTTKKAAAAVPHSREEAEPEAPKTAAQVRREKAAAAKAELFRQGQQTRSAPVGPEPAASTPSPSALVAAQELVLSTDGSRPPEPERLVDVEAIQGTPQEQFTLLDAEMDSTQSRFQRANIEYVIRAGTILRVMKERDLFKVHGFKDAIEYAQDKYGIEKSRTYQLMERAPTLQRVSKILETSPRPLAESGGLVLAQIAKEFGDDKATEVLKARTAEGKVTAKTLTSSLEDLRPTPKPTVAAPVAKAVAAPARPAAPPVLDIPDADIVEDSEEITPAPAAPAVPFSQEAHVTQEVRTPHLGDTSAADGLQALGYAVVSARTLEKLVTKESLKGAREEDPEGADALRAEIHRIVMRLQVICRPPQQL